MRTSYLYCYLLLFAFPFKISFVCNVSLDLSRHISKGYFEKDSVND